MDFRINHQAITNDLFSFVTTGNGILTGHPGTGKSYEVGKLVEYLQEKEYTVLFLPIDKIIAESDVDLQNELGLNSNIFEYIASDDHASPSKKGIVIIDAFDAARSGNKRNFYLKLIRKIIAKLGNKWSVLVVVRLYDAKKSVELLNLFPDTPETNKILQLNGLETSKEIPCRHVILPELNLDDLNHILVEHPIISKHSSPFNLRLKKLLFNPFYISLISQLIQKGYNLTNINSVYSEVQLLDLYWNSRIKYNPSGMSYEIFLKELTDEMISTHSLSVQISKLANFSEANVIYLLSTGILTNVGINKNKIAYTHNILFDYAVSRLVIDETENGLINFISTDKSNTILLRPSIQYYLTKIWYNDKSLFKKICIKLYKVKESEISLIGKIMPIQVLVKEADSIEDSKFISDLYDKGNKFREWLHTTIISTLESFEGKLEFPYPSNQKFWLDFFEQLIQKTKLSDDFYFVNWLYKVQNDEKDSDIQEQIGRISRKMLSTCLELIKNNQNIDKFTSDLPVVLVVKTFGTNPVQSRKILEKIFEIIRKENSKISYLQSLTYNLKEIFPFDMEFVSKIYVFAYNNRRQDFEWIRYDLGQEAGILLDSDLKIGLRTLIKCINYGVCRMHLLPHLQNGHSVQERIINFSFNKKESKFLEDFCYIWSDLSYNVEPEFEMLTLIKNKIIEISKNPDDKYSLKTVLNEYGDHAIVAILWRDLIKTISTNPEPFSSIIIDLLCAKPLQLHSETIDELAELIEKSIQYLSDDEIHQVVTSILITFDEIDDEDYKKYMQEKRNYLLSKIPLKFLPTEKVRIVVEDYLKNTNAPPYKPKISIEADVRYNSEQEILEIKNIDPNNYENKLILPNISIIKNFNDKWSSEKISEADALSILQPFKKLYTQIEEQNLKNPQNTIDYARDELTRCARIIAKGIKNPNSELFDYSRIVLLESAVPLRTQKREDFAPDYDPLSWSPTPVTDAAEGLLFLYSLLDDDDHKILNYINKLSQDEDPVVRLIIASYSILLFEKQPGQYWKIIDTFIENENNYKIHEIICRSLSIALKKKSECINDVRNRLESIWIKSKKLGIGELGLINNNCFIASVSYFAFVDETKWAKDFFDEVIQKPEQYLTLRPRIVSLIIDQFFKGPTILNSEYDGARKSISRWLKKIIKTAFDEIQQLFLAKPQLTEIDKKQLENLYGVIEKYIMRFFFVVDKKYNKINDLDESIQAIGIVYKSEGDTLALILDSLLKSDERMELRRKEIQFILDILDSCLGQDPEKVLELAVKTLKIGHRIGFSSDYFGKTKIQKFIDHLLENHRDILEDKIVMNNFSELLDNYIKGNSPEAIQYLTLIDLEYH
jgi:DNA-binding HxlR family transcriptional regulator